jgi:hypothetical protein
VSFVRFRAAASPSNLTVNISVEAESNALNEVVIVST